MIAGALAAALVAGGCVESEKHERGWDYLPDMYDSPAYRSYQSEVVGFDKTDADGTHHVEPHHVPMMMTPPAGTVPRDFVPYAIDANDWATARANPNPIVPTADVLRTGQANFNVYCVVCHGNDGNAANGYVAASPQHPGYFGSVPSVNSTNVAAMPDGEIYHIVTHGRGRMPNYRAQLPPETRWAVVHYVKALARATVAHTDAQDAFKAAQAEVERNPKSDVAKEAVAKAQALLEQAKKDHELITRGEPSIDAFTPKPAAVPEYVKPQWPEH